MANVTIIPAMKQVITGLQVDENVKRRVAGYARVSTDFKEQLTSYAAQVDYFTKYITSREDWQLVEVYTDEGISALSTKHRDGFNRMISDALAGKIDLIIMKSVSRFARNTVDSLTTVRKLCEVGVEIWFEEQSISTLDSKCELMLSIFSSLAQEESRSISENVTWGNRKKFANGKFSLPYAHFLGYDKGEDGFPKVNESEAETIRKIYSWFLEGQTPNGIAVKLTKLGIATPSGKAKWAVSTVKSILTNEKYQGCALLQKSYTKDYLTKTKIPNDGLVPQYFVEGCHEAIIEPVVFEMVQAEMKRRLSMPGYTGKNPFAAKIICGDCDSYFGAKLWHSKDEYRRTIFQCNSKYAKDKPKCATPHLTEDEVKTKFMSAVNELIGEREELFETFEEIRKTIFDTSEFDSEFDSLKAEIAVVAGLIQEWINKNATTVMKPSEFDKRYNALAERYEKANARLDEISAYRADKAYRERQMSAFLLELRKLPEVLTDYDDHLWHMLLDRAIVCSDGAVRFTFRDGNTITIEN